LPVKVSNSLGKLSHSLFGISPARTEFIDCILSPHTFSPAVIWTKPRPLKFPFGLDTRLGWQPDFVDRLLPHEKPGSSELHEKGFIYCLDFSSVFAASVVMAVDSEITHVMDVCAAPGGKGIFCWRAFSPGLVIFNEVIGKRTAALVSNLKRCDIKPALVTGMDSRILAARAESAFDLVVCDVPCSGQSLLVRGRDAPGCFHPSTINMNSNRQKRIIANSLKLVRPGGYLAYMTCTYSREENEEVIEWMMRRFPGFTPVEASFLAGYQSHLCDFPAYRLWPHTRLGAGAFSCLLRRDGPGEALELAPERLRVLWKS